MREKTEPEEGDWTTADHRKFYEHGKLVLSLPADLTPAEMWQHIDDAMEQLGYFPEVWFISDHGNAHLMEPPE